MHRSLPIDPILPELVRNLARSTSVILKAAPGSGKTTRVPPALLQAPFVRSKEVIVLEPRRLAAKYSARRVAEEMGEPIGKTVGYQFRFENVSSPDTRLRFITEGMLMRKLLHDPTLEGIAVVILDEFHERHLHTDAALAYLRFLQKTSRSDLKLVVMSATIDTASIAAFLGNCPVLEVEHRPHPVSTHYFTGSARPLESQVRDAVLKALEDPDDEGDILVFLPGMGEIRRSEQALNDYFGTEKNRPLVLALHGELSREEQDRAIQKASRRKVILSTNVAETSLTIDGVTVVIDSGLHRIATYSWWSGVPALKTRPISRASAIQRAGRAGRTAPGKCFRLYSQGDFEARAPFEVPEIQRADLSQTLLELKAMGHFDFSKLEWFEAPSATSIEASLKLLYRLGALDSPSLSSELTALGRKIAPLPAHPRLGRFLIEASRLGCAEDAATLASWIAEGRLERLDALDSLSFPLSEPQKKARSQLLTSLRSEPPAPNSFSSKEDRLRFALLTGFPDRVSKKRKAASTSQRAQANETELVFSSGGSARIEESGVIAHSEFFVTLDLRETQHKGQTRAKMQVSCVSPIQMEWLLELAPSLLEDCKEFTWDSQKSRVMEKSQLLYDGLILEESSRPATRGPAASEALMKAVLGIDPSRAREMSAGDWVQSLSKLQEREAVETVIARTLLLKKHFPENVPAFELSHLVKIFDQKNSLAELKEMDLGSEILAALVPQCLAQIDRWLPETLPLPSGRRGKIYYALDKGPWLESRLQDFFGMKAAPSLLEGRIPLTLHLLAPNHRALQVTTDLAGFWERGYREQRNALSRRYPRHAWPEDPLKPLPPNGKKPG